MRFGSAVICNVDQETGHRRIVVNGVPDDARVAGSDDDEVNWNGEECAPGAFRMVPCTDWIDAAQTNPRSSEDFSSTPHAVLFAGS